MNRYLRSSLVIIRYGSNRYVLFHPGSSSILSTDRLGAYAASLLVRGKTETDIAQRVEGRCAGAGARFDVLLERLAAFGAITTEAPVMSLRRRLKIRLSFCLGSLLSASTVILQRLPSWLLRTLVHALPSLPMTKSTVGQIAPYVDVNLCAFGYANMSSEWRLSIAKSCANASIRWYFYLYLCLVLPTPSARQLTKSLFDSQDMRQLERVLDETEGAVIATLHTELIIALYITLAQRERGAALIADIGFTGVALATDAAMNEAMAADADGQKYESVARHIINSRSMMASKTLLTYLRKGSFAFLMCDVRPQHKLHAETVRSIHFMKQRIYCWQGLAWLAIHTGKPVIFVGTYWQDGHVKIECTKVSRPEAGQSRKEQIAAYTTEIYKEGEVFLQRHPESWMVWSYAEQLTVKPEPMQDDIQDAPSASDLVAETER